MKKVIKKPSWTSIYAAKVKQEKKEQKMHRAIFKDKEVRSAHIAPGRGGFVVVLYNHGEPLNTRLVQSHEAAVMLGRLWVDPIHLYEAPQ